MAVRVGEEQFSDVILELDPHLKRHYEEIALNQDIIPLCPDMAKYSEMEARWTLLCVIARDVPDKADTGPAVGYVAFIIDRLLHNATITGAVLDVLWVAPEHRRGGVADALLDLAERVLNDRGVVLVHVRSKVAHPALAHLLERRGYTHVEAVHAKVLQRPE